MKIGFTGTQKGMSQRQIKALTIVIRDTNIHGFHHGDCIGADAKAHEIVRNEDKEVWIVIHPPDIPTKRAFKKGDEIRQPFPYLERNYDIVNETDLLVAAPSSLIEERRSGTWTTIRYARKINKPILILDR